MMMVTMMKSNYFPFWLWKFDQHHDNPILLVMLKSSWWQSNQRNRNSLYDGDQHWDLLLLHLPAPLCPRLLVPPWRLVFLFWRTFLPVISSWTICFCDTFFKTILRNHNFLGHTPSLKILAIILTHVSKDCVDWDHFPALNPLLEFLTSS